MKLDGPAGTKANYQANGETFMRNQTHRIGIATLIAAAITLAGSSSRAAEGAAAPAADTGRVEKVSSSSFADTVKKLESVLKTEHMMIVGRVDHRSMLSMVGAKIRGATTVEFGKPEMGKMLLPMNPAVGLEMPARIYLYENADGKTVISYRKGAANFATYGPEVAKAGEMMDMTLEKIASAAAQ